MIKESCVRVLLFAVFALLSFPLTVAAECWDIEAKIGYFYPTSHKMRKIYEEGIPLYQLELDYNFCLPWSAWTSVGWATKKGHSRGLHHETRLNLYPLGAGLKYNFDLSCMLQGYLGAGLTYTILNITDHSECVHEKVRKNSFGGVAKAGILYRFCNCTFAELFLDYYYVHFHSSRSSHCVSQNGLEAGGFVLGIGAGIEF